MILYRRQHSSLQERTWWSTTTPARNLSDPMTVLIQSCITSFLQCQNHTQSKVLLSLIWAPELALSLATWLLQYSICHLTVATFAEILWHFTDGIKFSQGQHVYIGPFPSLQLHVIYTSLLISVSSTKACRLFTGPKSYQPWDLYTYCLTYAKILPSSSHSPNSY